MGGFDFQKVLRKTSSSFFSSLGNEAADSIKQTLPRVPAPPFTEDLIELQQQDQIRNPVRNFRTAFEGNLNPPRGSRNPNGGDDVRIDEVGTLSFGPRGLFGDVELSTAEIATLGVIGVGGILLALRIGRVI